jgi:hypothetical protein
VFVLLRDRPGVYERSVLSSGPLAAQDKIAAADRSVVATLGSQFMGHAGLPADAERTYRAVQAVDRRFAALHSANSSGSAMFAPVPLVEVLGARDSGPSR